MKRESKFKQSIYSLANMLIPDSIYTRLKFKMNLKRWPNLTNPQTFNEKLCLLEALLHKGITTPVGTSLNSIASSLLGIALRANIRTLSSMELSKILN